MKALLKNFTSFSLLVQTILFLCLFGLILETGLLYQDIVLQKLLWRLHLGFCILYAAQLGLILLKEKWVCVLTVLQGLLALLTTADFIFTPILRFVGGAYFMVTIPTVEGLKIYQYVFVSLAFTLQMFSAYVLFVEFDTSAENSSSSLPETDAI